MSNPGAKSAMVMSEQSPTTNSDGGSVHDVVGTPIGASGGSAAISAVGGAAEGTGRTLSVSPETVGDVMVLTVSTNSNPAPTVTSVSGGGVSTWSLAKGETDNSYGYADDEKWTSVATATGAAVARLMSECLNEAMHRWAPGSSVRFVVDVGVVLRWSDAQKPVSIATPATTGPP
jgi:hypothetical protein